MEKQTILVCEECGSREVETLEWRNPNTGEYGGDMGDAYRENNWCKVCEDHVNLITEEEWKTQQSTE